MRKAKIVCTLGPASSSPDDIRALVDAGMDVARMNMSHGVHDDHRRNYEHVRQAAAASGRAVGVFADLQGPKIRLGTIVDGPVELEAGQPFSITTRDVPGDARLASTTYAGLPGDVKPGDPILIDDGRVRLRVVGATEDTVETLVEVAGPISDHKGINLPGVAVSVPALSDKDVEDLRFALSLGVDFIALSFVRNGHDVDGVRAIMDEVGVHVPVIAKIEKPQAVDNIDDVIENFDAIMVARGDLGVECPLEDVPFIQKMVIEKARRNAKPVIVATQMLDSMIGAPAPTRAETSDVANAVLDGADAVMLSGETSIGDYPLEAVRTMARILTSAEEQGLDKTAKIDWQPHTKGGIIAKAAAEVAERAQARYLVAFTQSGDSARRVSRYRGHISVLAFTPLEKVRNQLALTWGVQTFQTPAVEHTDQMVMQVDEALLQHGRAEEGEMVVIIFGAPPGIPGSTNAVHIHRMGDAINGVVPAYRR